MNSLFNYHQEIMISVWSKFFAHIFFILWFWCIYALVCQSAHAFASSLINACLANSCADGGRLQSLAREVAKRRRRHHHPRLEGTGAGRGHCGGGRGVLLSRGWGQPQIPDPERQRARQHLPQVRFRHCSAVRKRKACHFGEREIGLLPNHSAFPSIDSWSF